MQQKRREKLEIALASLEAEFRTLLVQALGRCAGGSWGLFGQNAHMEEQAYASSGAQKLDALGSEIALVREELGLAEPFALYAEFKQKRGRKTQNDLGEARLAGAWLQELDA
jgi:hypothetical protein